MPAAPTSGKAPPPKKGIRSLDKKPRRLRAAEGATQRPQKKKFANTRNALQKTQDHAFIARWRHYGLPVDALVVKLNEHLVSINRPKLSRAQIAADLKQVEDAWRAEREFHVTHLRDRDLQKLDADELQLVEAWEKSKLPTVKKKFKNVTAGAPPKEGEAAPAGRTERAGEEVSSYGDPAIYAQILRVRELRARICGWLAPVKVTATGPDGGPMPVGAGAVPIVHVTIAPPPPGEK